MGILSLFKSGKLIENVSSGLDKAVFTKEERADMFPQLLELYGPFKQAQRWLMCIVCIPYMLLWFLTGAAALVMDVWSVGGDVDNVKEMLHGPIKYVVGTICSFYFGGGAVEGIMGKWKGDKKK